MRVFISQLLTESNSFAPIPSGRGAFEEFGIHRGDASAQAPEGVFATLALWRRLAENAGHGGDRGTCCASAAGRPHAAQRV